MNLDSEVFVKRCEQDSFRNRDELLEGIKSGEIVLGTHKFDSDLPCVHFIEIYAHREKHLDQFQTDHSKRLRHVF